MEDTLYWVWLSLCFSYGSDKPNEILSHFKTPKEFYDCTEQDMQTLAFLSRRQVETIKHTSLLRAQKVIDDCKSIEVQILTMSDELYPKRLLHIYGPPPVLYYRGNIADIDSCVAIGIVGTRHSIPYTERATAWIAEDLAAAGAIVVSGGAMGIDASAHYGALKSGRTIAVLGCGHDVNYPAGNAALREEIIKRNGALISEIPPKTKTIGNYFPTRNRLIAGISLGVLVSHAPVRSGALITAEHALEQGKEVYCLPPYDIMNLQAMGVMKYIRDGSKVIACAEDILVDFYYGYADWLEKDSILGDYVARKKQDDKLKKIQTEEAQATVAASVVATVQDEEALKQDFVTKYKDMLSELDDQQNAIYLCLGAVPRYIDEISNDSTLSVGTALAVLTELEILGIAASFGGKRYALNIGEDDK